MIALVLALGTLGAWLAARALYPRVPRLDPSARSEGDGRGKTGRIYFHPVVVAGVALAIALAVTRIPSADYAHATRVWSWLLGPTVVGFATQLHARRAMLRQGGVRLVAVFVGASLVSLVAAAGIARALGASPSTIRSLVPASSTSPIAGAVADAHGGRGTVAIAACMIIGLVGAVFGPIYARYLGLNDEARGAALGVSAHGIGTGAAVEHSEAAGASAGLALVVQGLLVAALAPIGYAIFAWLR